MTLADGQIGAKYRVIKMSVEENTERRLEALGMTEGTWIEVLNRKKNDTAIFNVRGTRLAVGREIALGIEVEGGGAA